MNRRGVLGMFSGVFVGTTGFVDGPDAGEWVGLGWCRERHAFLDDGGRSKPGVG